MKLMKLTDSSDHGLETVAEYMTNELADDSNDDKRIDRAEKTAAKRQRSLLMAFSKESKARSLLRYAINVAIKLILVMSQ